VPSRARSVIAEPVVPHEHAARATRTSPSSISPVV
jgi:hypothetical protein